MKHSKNILAKPKQGVANPRNQITYGFMERDFPGRVAVHEFSLRRALFGRFDVFHMHWPDRVFRRGDAAAAGLVFGLWVLLSWLRLRGTSIAWTVHNPRIKNRRPARWLEYRYFRLLTRKVDRLVYPSLQAKRVFADQLARFGLGTQRQLSAHIPLGLQGELLEKGDMQPPELTSMPENSILLVGRVDTEKTFDKTITDVYSSDHFTGFNVILAGRPANNGIERQFTELAKSHPFISLLRLLDDEEVNYLVRQCSYVLVDYEIENSGVATLAAAAGSKLVFSTENQARAFFEEYAYPRCYYFRRADGEIQGLTALDVAGEDHAWNADQYSLQYVSHRLYRFLLDETAAAAD